MMFQSLLMEIGITGWILRMYCVPRANRYADEIADRVLSELGKSSALISAIAGAQPSHAMADAQTSQRHGLSDVCS